MRRLDRQLFNAISRCDATKVIALIAAGADVNAEHDQMCRPLHWAAHDATLTGLLLDAGAWPEVWNGNGVSPLHEAAYYGNRAVLELLFAAGARVDGRRFGGNTPAHEAAAAEDVERAKDNLLCLIEHGADLSARNWSGETPADLAVFWSPEELAGWSRATTGGVA